MEKYKPQAGFGNLFVNETKEGKQPDRQGKLAVPFDCKKGDILDLSGWLKDGAKGTFLSLTAQAEWVPEGEAKDTPIPRRNSTGFGDMDDDVPF